MRFYPVYCKPSKIRIEFRIEFTRWIVFMPLTELQIKHLKPLENFNLFLKECEWRFNIGTPKEQLEDLKKLLKEFY